VIDFNARDFLTEEKVATMGRSSQFAVAAAKMAVEDAKIDLSAENRYRVAVSMGTTMGEPQILDQAVRQKYTTSDPASIPAGLPRQYPANAIPTNVAREFKIQGPTVIIPTACAAGNYAIGYAYDMIGLDHIDMAIVGGADPFSSLAFTGFNRLLATTEDVVRPFDKNRGGMAVSEGAGVMFIESLEHALQRNAPIYAEILGYGLGCDAFKMTIPDPEGSGGILCLNRAMKNAGIRPEQIDYVCAHGTGTGENDKCETMIIKKCLGDHAYKAPMTSLKSMLGHTMGAASAIEAAACVLMLKHNIILPTINYSEPDPECDLDCVPNQSREANLNIVVSNAYAFAGNCSTIVLSKFKG
jgi:3-oxoacyl-[acyl-carrier-protein] synthase II